MSNYVPFLGEFGFTLYARNFNKMKWPTLVFGQINLLVPSLAHGAQYLVGHGDRQGRQHV